MTTTPSSLPRRRMLLACAASLIALACAPRAEGRKPTAAAADRFADDPWRRLDQAAWRERLTPAAYAVLRQHDTERAFTSPLNDEQRRGTFHCAGCDLPLFQSTWKYDSGTGWPSFSDAIRDNLGFSTDFVIGYPRTEYHCARCLGHQGHVFDDGPAPTGLRYCNNGVALRFAPAA